MLKLAVVLVAAVLVLSLALRTVGSRLTTADTIKNIGLSRLAVRDSAQSIARYAAQKQDFTLDTLTRWRVFPVQEIDAFGTAMTYCVLPTPTVSSGLIAAVISGGPDRRVDTVCSALSTTGRVGDDIVWALTWGDMLIAQSPTNMAPAALGHEIR